MSNDSMAHFRGDDTVIRHWYQTVGGSFKAEDPFSIMDTSCEVSFVGGYTKSFTPKDDGINHDHIYDYLCGGAQETEYGPYPMQEVHCYYTEDSDGNGTGTCVPASHACVALENTTVQLNTTTGTPPAQINNDGCHASFTSTVNPHSTIANCYVANYNYSGQESVDKFADNHLTSTDTVALPIDGACNNGAVPEPTPQSCEDLAGLETVLLYPDNNFPAIECINGCNAGFNGVGIENTPTEWLGSYTYLLTNDPNYGVCTAPTTGDTGANDPTASTNNSGVESRLDVIIQQNTDLQGTASATNSILTTIDEGINGSITGGADCDTPPVCVGSDLLCESIKQEWHQRCDFNNSTYDDLVNNGLPTTLDNNFTMADITTDIDFQTLPAMSDFFGFTAHAGTCPADRPLALSFGSYTVPYFTFCSLAESIAPLLMAMAYLVGVRNIYTAYTGS